jgi:hypothetical protein
MEPTDEENPSIECIPENKYIDELTMRLLLNNTNYAKYLSKTDAQKYEEQQAFILDCDKFQRPVMDMTMHMLRDPTISYSTEISDAFHQYARILIRYLEVKERSEEMQKEYASDGFGDGEEEDVLFPASMNEPPNPLRTKEKPFVATMSHKKFGRRTTMDNFIPRIKDTDEETD